MAKAAPVLFSERTRSCATALAMLVAGAAARRFDPSIRLHDRALFELSELVRLGNLELDTASWRFVPSPNGGCSLVGLADVLLILSEEGWLRRDVAESVYEASPEFLSWGTRAIAALSVDQRRLVVQLAERWKARASVSSKKVA
jgi:hypothetical protein